MVFPSTSRDCRHGPFAWDERFVNQSWDQLNQFIEPLVSTAFDCLDHFQSKIKEQPKKSDSSVRKDDKKFCVKVDVHHFSAEELEVKINGNNLIVRGQHEEKQDASGWISRQFTRRFEVPDNCDIEKIKSSLSEGGVLSIEAPMKETVEKSGEQTIPIIFEKNDKPVDLDEMTMD